MAEEHKNFKSFTSLISRSVRVFVNLPTPERKKLSFSIKKSYKDATSGEWKATSVLFPEDIAALVEILPKALEWAGTQNFNQIFAGAIADAEEGRASAAATKAAEDKKFLDNLTTDDLPW